MISTAIAARLARAGLHYGWLVVGVTFLAMLATAGTMGSIGVIIEPLHREFGWSTSEISFAMAVRLVLYGLFGPFAAAMMNRFGIGNVVTFALGLIVVGIVGSFYMTALWQLVLCWGILVGIGTGITALVLGATVATRWFSARRGLVMGILTVSNATGQLVFLPIVARLTEAYGWRTALTLVIAMLVLAVVLMRVFIRDYPVEVGLAPYGEEGLRERPAVDGGLGTMMMAPVRTLGEVAGSNTFWVLFATFYVCGLSTNGLIQTHWISICGDFGVAPVTAASILATVGALDFFGTLGSGWLSDRLDNRFLLFWYYGLRGLSLIFLAHSSFGIYELSIFGVFYGLDWIATVPPTVRLAADRFGREKANLAFGWIFAGHQLGAATAAWGAGAIRTSTASYMPALYIAGLMCVVAAVLIILIRRPGRVAVVQ